MRAYPVPGKKRSADLCAAFIEGAKKLGSTSIDAVFSGVKEGNVNEWRWVVRTGLPYYYIDNSYFDETRATHFRVTRNALQYQHHDPSTGERLRAAFGGKDPVLASWQVNSDGHILIIEQSEIHFRCTIGYKGRWIDDAIRKCQEKWPGRKIRVRPWSANKVTLIRDLPADLEGAWAVYTHTSAAAITAARLGIPAFTSKEHALAGWSFHPEDQRLHCFRVLADNQWTLDEMTEGKAWAWLDRHGIAPTGSTTGIKPKATAR